MNSYVPNYFKKEVIDVLNAVEGTFAEANKNILQLVKTNLDLSKDEVHAIMASFLIEKYDILCKILFGEQYGHAFFKSFGINIPKYSKNQLQHISLGELFYNHYVKNKNIHDQIDPQLHRLFRYYYIHN
jgi:hypothetical protein